jgi:hypothetical protein
VYMAYAAVILVNKSMSHLFENFGAAGLSGPSFTADPTPISLRRASLSVTNDK